MNRRGLLGALGALGLLPAAPELPYSRANGAASASRRQSSATATELVVLGLAQDAGVPQINCFKDHCRRVRAGQAARPRVASLGFADHAAQRRFLIDATPDFTAQVGELLTLDGGPPEGVDGTTAPLHEHLHGVFLTHGHMGHYTGLVQIGKEGAAPRGVPVYGSASMAEFLSTNAPWDALVDGGHVQLRAMQPGVRVALTDTLAVTPFSVIHRAEYTDTFGYLIHGPSATALYVPDADVWDGWPEPFEQLLTRCDVAFIDGSFWSLEELGHRVAADIPHPPVSQTLAHLRGRPDLPEIRFIHLNHTNPLWNEAAPQHAELSPPFALAREGERIPL